MADRRSFFKGAATTVGAAIAAKWRINPDTSEIEPIGHMTGDMLVSDTPDFINMLIDSHNALARKVKSLELYISQS